MLDDAFVDMLRNVIGKEKFARVIKENPQILAKVLKGWETCKVSFREGEPLPGTGGMSYEDYELFVTHVTMEKLYAPIVKKISYLVKKMLQDCQSKDICIKHILCIGGFSKSTYLIRMLRGELAEADASKIAGPLRVLPTRAFDTDLFLVRFFGMKRV
ncbi:hypothetical protein GGF32_004244 [Allomyces javanicus]|nr:hypothetical protein GGF32_004244 [Allomyces javanicus]